MDLALKGKLVLVTGAAGGLGSEIAKGFAKEGSTVLVADYYQDNVGVIVSEIIAEGGKAFPVIFDAADRKGLKVVSSKIQEEFGDIDILINNAGVSSTSRIDHENSDEEWDRLININLTGVYNVTRAFMDSLIKTEGCIVNTASICSFINGVSATQYIVSKGGVRSLTQALARDFAKYNIRVNAIAPGFMHTPMVNYQLKKQGGTDWYMNRVPVGRGGQPSEIIGPVLFLSSNKVASYVNGVILPVDGGFLTA